MSMLISVIIPVYNVEQYLSTCLSSVVNQNYTNLEIILINDGSTDRSGAICDEWAQKDKRIRVIHKANKGVSESRNTGLIECKGQLIGFVDADDWIETDMYQTLTDRILEANADVVMCGYYDYPHGMDNPVERGIIATDDGTFADTALSIIKRNGYFTSIWNKLFRRDIIFRNDKIVLMDSSLSYGEDEVWLYEVLWGCKKISYIPRALYHWRAREDSMTRVHKLSSKKMSIIEAKKKTLQLLPSNKAVISMEKGSIYDGLDELMVIAYITKDKRNYVELYEFIHPFRGDFIRSKEIRPVRRIKMCLIDFCMKMKMPALIVNTLLNCR